MTDHPAEPAVDPGRGPARRQRGQGVAEYALILVLVALLIVAGLVLLSAYLGPSIGTATPVPSSGPGPSFVPPSLTPPSFVPRSVLPPPSA